MLFFWFSSKYSNEVTSSLFEGTHLFFTIQDHITVDCPYRHLGHPRVTVGQASLYPWT
jgi:hypothetical protein